MKCKNCNEEVDDVCGDGFCRKCHVSVSWEDCVSHTFEAKLSLELYKRIGIMKNESRKMVKEVYPNAKI